MINKITYENRIIFDDNLVWFKNLILNTEKLVNIYFNFKNIEESFKKVKNIILENKKNIDFKKLYFYNANDFINFILDKEIYLPYNINLFICTSCVIGCTYCNNHNNSRTYLSFKDIKNFFSNYLLADNVNINIIWQWDPIFNPDLIKIIEFLKEKWVYITFFTWWKSLLFSDEEKRKKIIYLVDEFKINLSASSYKVYNRTHSNKITEKDFNKLLNIFKKIANKSTFIFIIIKENVNDLVNFIKFVLNINWYAIEFKKNMHYINNDILDNKKVYFLVEKIIKRLIKYKKNNVITNFSTKLNFFIKNKFNKNKTLLDYCIDNILNNITIEEINSLDKCFQFWNSLDITENKKLAICCHYEDSIISDINWLYYKENKFREKKYKFRKNTPKWCRKCPMPIDRYKNYLKFEFINQL